jgi:HlyD family secretion protein
MKKIITVLVILLVGAGTAIYLKSGNNTVKFRTSPVVAGPLRATVTANGTMNAVTTVLVGTQVSGTIQRLYVDFNSRVKKGDIIAQIDPSTFQAQVDQARANVLVAKANVVKARATLSDSIRIRDRNRQLFSRNLVARSDVDTAEANHDANEAQVQASVAQVAQTEAALRFAETNLRYTRIISPVDGTIVSRSVDVGQTVAASFQTPTLFTIAQDLKKMQIDTNIDEADIGKIQTGQEVEFNVDAYPDRIFHGKVEQVRIAPITVQNVVTYDVVIKVDNEDLKLKPGMTANVAVVVAGKEKALKIPNAALRFRPPEKDGVSIQLASTTKTGNQSAGQQGPPGKTGSRVAGPRSYAIWVLENNQPKRVPVTVGISDGAFTEITSGEISEGQEIIIESVTKSSKPGNSASQSSPRFIR